MNEFSGTDYDSSRIAARILILFGSTTEIGHPPGPQNDTIGTNLHFGWSAFG